MMYLAYLKFETLKDKKQDASEVSYAIIGKDSEDIVQKALSYGTESHFVSGMIELNKDW